MQWHGNVYKVMLVSFNLWGLTFSVMMTDRRGCREGVERQSGKRADKEKGRRLLHLRGTAWNMEFLAGMAALK